MSLIFSFFIALQLFAAPPKASIVINADNYKSNPDQTADLNGHVKVVREDEILTCDKAHVNNATGEIFANGNVVFISTTQYVRAEKMNYNFITKKGVIYNGLLQSEQETVEGEIIYKTGEDEFSAERGSYTSCVNCPPSWKLSGKKIDATVGGYAYITQPLIKIYSIPVLWLPWIAIPIKNKRQSGLLAPNFESKGAGGSAFGESYFWAISDSKDATLTETYFDKRGLKSGLEYRFVSDANSSGYFKANYVKDRFFPDTTDYTTLDNRYTGANYLRPGLQDLNRYSIKYKQHVELPEGFTQNTKINLISDTRYIYDFSDDMPGTGEPALDNRINLSKNTENTNSSIEVSIYQNLLKIDPVGQDQETVHRMPEIKFSYAPQKILNSILLGMDLDYINFANSGRTFYETSGTTIGTNPTTNTFRTGQRLSVHPSLALPFNLFDFIDFLPQIEYEETFYQFGYGNKPTTSRRYLRTSLNAKSRFSAIFGDDSIHSTKYKHEAIPEINYTVIPSFYQENHPFFGTSNLPFAPSYAATQPITEFDDAIQFDYKDRITDQNLLTFALTNKIVRKKTEDKSTDYREIIYHRLSQSYDVYSSRQPDLFTTSAGQTKNTIKQPWSEIRSLFELRLDHLGFSSDVSYYQYETKTISSNSLSLTNDHGDGIALGYSQGYQIKPNYFDPSLSRLLFGARSESTSVSAYFTSKYLDFNGTTAFDVANNWKPTSFTMRGLLKPPGKCWGFGFYYYKIFGGDTGFVWSLPIFFGEGRSMDLGHPGG